MPFKMKMRFARSLSIPILAGLLSACGEARRAEEPPPAQSPLVGSESVDGLAALHDTVHARALRGDTLGLLRVLVNDSTYRAHVWPVSPVYEEREEVWNFVIGMHKANSVKGMRRLLGDILVPGNGAVEFPDFGTTEIPGGVLYYAPKSERGKGGVRLFGSALCLEDACRVLSYNQGGAKGSEGSEGTKGSQGGETANPENQGETPSP